MVVCIQDVVGNNNFLVRFEDSQKREISDFSMLYLCSKYEVGQEVDETIYNLPKRLQDRLLTIYGYLVFKVSVMFLKGVCLYIYIYIVEWVP